MSSSTQHTLAPMLRKLELRGALTDEDRQAFLSLPFRLRTVEANVYLVREGDRPDQSSVIINGFAFRHKVTQEGERQIVSLHMRGDFVDLEASLLNIADHNIQTLSRCEMALIPREAVRSVIVEHPKVGMAMWVDTLIDASIFREWVMNVGQRDARARIAHLLCEFSRRLEIAGLADEAGYSLPMTQEQIANSTGLTTVHVNRVLKQLGSEGLIVRSKRELKIPDWEKLRSVAGFNETYLHLDQVARDKRPDRSV